MVYDLAIIGGGPAGAAAGVYAARKRLKTIFITKDWLGQSAVSDNIENWIGTTKISGMNLAQSLEKHVKAYADGVIEIKEGEICTNIERSTSPTSPSGSFSIQTDKSWYEAKSILIVSGSHRKKLEITGADKFEHKGLTYCATCDGPLYTGQDVVVIGGGNAAFDSAAQLMAYCKTVTIMNRSENFRADPGTIEAVKRNPNIKILTSAVPVEIKGEKFVSSIVYKNAKTNKNHEIETTGIFVEIGSLPNTDFAKNIVNLDELNRIPVDARNQQTKTKGIWAAGDCTDGLYHQNNIAAGDAVKAIEDIYIHLKTK